MSREKSDRLNERKVSGIFSLGSWQQRWKLGKDWREEPIEGVFKDPITLADPDIRYCVLASLDERFDAHLAQAENLQALFVALNDQVFEIRELAICTVGRLSSMNPAFVMPFLRKMLIQVMMES